jgi:quinol monooxygenase YgiN
MIIVSGSFEAKDGRLNEALALSLAHVQRSREEVGCVSHTVHQDAENPNRLFFFEEWTDLASLESHFSMPYSNQFAKAVVELAASKPSIQVFTASQLSL